MKRIITVALMIASLVMGHAGGPGAAFNPGQPAPDIDSIMKVVELIPVLVNGEKDNRRIFDFHLDKPHRSYL